MGEKFIWQYIRRMDCCTNIAEIVYVHDQMALDFVCRMRRLKKNIASSKQVAEAIDYIYVHIMDRITVNDLAEAVCVSPTHLSRIFKQETGQRERRGRRLCAGRDADRSDGNCPDDVAPATLRERAPG